MTRWLLLTIGTGALAACMTTQQADTLARRPATTADAGGASAAPATIVPPTIPSDVTATLKDPAGAHEELCTADSDHPNFPDDADELTSSFCQDKKAGGVVPTPKSLADLQKQLGLDFKDINGGNGVGGNPAFALLGHSSALTARKVSTVMPTAFVFTPPPADGSKLPGKYSILAFDPGEQFVEVASYDATVKNMNFYVVFFDKDCTHTAAACTNGDLLTAKLTTGWSNLRVYEDTTDLNNTILDCHVCHQPNANGDPFLRMQENTAPFTHWFSSETEGGKALLLDYHKMHNGDYGGIPAALVDKSDPSKLAALLKQAGASNQPNAFPSQTIEAELKASNPAQPMTNNPPGKSATWQTLYDNAAAGQFIAPPYHDVKTTDPLKITSMAKAYAAWLSGTTTELPDIREVFLDEGLRDMGFAPKAGLDGRGLIVQMCQECHNSNLDMTLSRELFLVDKLDAMSRGEKDLAISRLKTSPDTRLAMPPALFRSITDEERQLMIDELQK